MQPIARIIDANANRSREALRVLEEAARFILNDPALTEQLKQIRHDLVKTLSALPGGELMLQAYRDTPGDVGTRISTSTERRRASMRDVVLASGKRLSEALRTIEEYLKLTDGLGEGRVASAAIEQLRYRAYEAEKRIVLAMGAGRGMQWRLCVLITESLCTHQDWPEVARLAIEGGADCLQLREKDLTDRELLDRAELLVDICRSEELTASCIINDRPDIALLARADGVHVGPNDLPIEDVRRLAGDRLLIGVSTSSIEQAERASWHGADYCGVGAMFPTTTKQKDNISGLSFLREYLAHDPPLPPHLAIGGITPENIGELVEIGVRGVAVSSAVCGAEKPREVCERIAGMLRPTPEGSMNE